MATGVNVAGSRHLSPGLVSGALILLVAAAMLPRALPLTVAAIGAVAMLAFVELVHGRTVDPLAVPLVAAVAYFMMSGFLVGALVPVDLLNLDFYDGDGRFFVAYFPTLLITLVRMRREHVDLMIRLAVAVAVGALCCIPLWYFGWDGGLFGDYRFLWLQTHHTAAGTIFGMVAILLFVVGAYTNRWVLNVLAVLLLVPLVLTTSRQALLSVIVALGVLAVLRFKALIPVLVIVAALTVSALPNISPSAYERLEQLGSVDTIENMRSQLRTLDWRPEYGIGESLVGEQWNILARLLFYIRATNMFFDSPIFGAGFGRFNDYYVQYSGIPGLVYIGTSGERVFNSKSAHNSYLHFVGETGVVGLGLVAWFWVALFRRLLSAERAFRTAGDQRMVAACVAAKYMIIPMIIGAAFGHAFATPSFGFFILGFAGTVVRVAQCEKEGAVDFGGRLAE